MKLVYFSYALQLFCTQNSLCILIVGILSGVSHKGLHQG